MSILDSLSIRKSHPELHKSLKKLIQRYASLSSIERQQFQAVFKQIVDIKRLVRLKLKTMEESASEEGKTLIRERIQLAEKDLNSVIQDVLLVIDTYLLPKSERVDVQATLFYQKIKGDCFRYCAEHSSGERRIGLIYSAIAVYTSTLDECRSEHGLPTTHPLRLSLALNFSLLLYEIVHNVEQACQVANQALHEVKHAVEFRSGEIGKESMKIIRLIEHNLTMWIGDGIYQSFEQFSSLSPKVASPESSTQTRTTSAYAGAASPSSLRRLE